MKVKDAPVTFTSVKSSSLPRYVVAAMSGNTFVSLFISMWKYHEEDTIINYVVFPVTDFI